MPKIEVDTRGSRVVLTDQLGQRIAVTIYTPDEWERIPKDERTVPRGPTTDGRYHVTLTDA